MVMPIDGEVDWVGVAHVIEARGEQVLRCREYGIRQIPGSFFSGAVTLCELELSHNHLTALPPQIGLLTNLKMLLLDHNALSELPVEIGNLVQLQVLHLQCNSLAFVPEQLCSLPDLRHFKVLLNAFDFAHRQLLLPNVGPLFSAVPSLVDMCCTSLVRAQEQHQQHSLGESFLPEELRTRIRNADQCFLCRAPCLPGYHVPQTRLVVGKKVLIRKSVCSADCGHRALRLDAAEYDGNRGDMTPAERERMAVSVERMNGWFAAMTREILQHGGGGQDNE